LTGENGVNGVDGFVLPPDERPNPFRIASGGDLRLDCPEFRLALDCCVLIAGWPSPPFGVFFLLKRPILGWNEGRGYAAVTAVGLRFIAIGGSNFEHGGRQCCCNQDNLLPSIPQIADCRQEARSPVPQYWWAPGQRLQRARCWQDFRIDEETWRREGASRLCAFQLQQSALARQIGVVLSRFRSVLAASASRSLLCARAARADGPMDSQRMRSACFPYSQSAEEQC
jgi:hypothetical protein